MSETNFCNGNMNNSELNSFKKVMKLVMISTEATRTHEELALARGIVACALVQGIVACA